MKRRDSAVSISLTRCRAILPDFTSARNRGENNRRVVEGACLSERSELGCNARNAVRRMGSSRREVPLHFLDRIITNTEARLTDSEEALPTGTPGLLQYRATLRVHVVIKALNYSSAC